jgi:hypothetical protein
MNFKKIILPLIALAFSIISVSCNNGSSEKNEAAETKAQEASESTKPDISNVTAVLPAGEIALDKLPAGVKEFAAKNYPGYMIIKAASDPLCKGGDAIDGAITKAGAPNLSLIFKPNGSFVQKEEDVSMSTATDKIRNAVKTKYADYSAGNQIEKLILADKTVQYLVDLTKGKVSKEVIFNMEGNVVCEN